jgi:hypothetical protein
MFMFGTQEIRSFNCIEGGLNVHRSIGQKIPCMSGSKSLGLFTVLSVLFVCCGYASGHPSRMWAVAKTLESGFLVRYVHLGNDWS